jgi:8-oxo-dGTP pyrophosphatase MutT (NUDIX family)
MKTYVIASAIVKHKNEYLIGRRAKTKRFGAEKWEFISGFIEEKEPVEETILKEVREETSLGGAILKSGDPYIAEDKEARWLIIPFLIEAGSNKIVLNKKDHSELKWVSSKQLDNYADLTEDVKQFKKRGFL